MDYKEKYERALERAKKELNTCGSQDCDAARQILRLFPELKINEDERIRNEFCKDIWTFIPNEKAHKYIAWLEKQSKEKVSTVDWKPSDEQMKALKDACDEHWESDGLDPLYSLWEQLKKLKGE